MTSLNAGQKVFVMQLLLAQVSATGRQPTDQDLQNASSIALKLDGKTIEASGVQKPKRKRRIKTTVKL